MALAWKIAPHEPTDAELLEELNPVSLNLTARDYRALTEALDRPARPIEALKQSMLKNKIRIESR